MTTVKLCNIQKSPEKMTAKELESSIMTGTSVSVANHPCCHKFSDKRDTPSSSIYQTKKEV